MSKSMDDAWTAFSADHDPESREWSGMKKALEESEHLYRFAEGLADELSVNSEDAVATLALLIERRWEKAKK